MGRLTKEQLEQWVLGLLERAEKTSDLMAKNPSVPSGQVAELTGYAKSALILLSDKQIRDYHQKRSNT